MKKTLFMFVVALLATSCSKEAVDREVTVSDVDVTGVIKDYVEVVDGTYKFTKNDREGHITVKLRRKDQPAGDFNVVTFPKIRLNAIGGSGEIFDTGYYGFEADKTEFDKVRELVASGKAGDTKSVSFTWRYLGQDEALAQKIYNDAATFELIDAGFEIPSPETADDIVEIDDEFSEYEDYDAIVEEHRLNEMYADTETAQPKSGSTIDYDKWIDEYEECFNSLIKFHKKVSNGDQSYYADYLDAINRFNGLTEKLHGAENFMTPDQTMRMVGILEKYSREVQK